MEEHAVNEMLEFKAKGNQTFASKYYEKAIEFYKNALHNMNFPRAMFIHSTRGANERGRYYFRTKQNSNCVFTDMTTLVIQLRMLFWWMVDTKSHGFVVQKLNWRWGSRKEQVNQL